MNTPSMPMICFPMSRLNLQVVRHTHYYHQHPYNRTYHRSCNRWCHHDLTHSSLLLREHFKIKIAFVCIWEKERERHTRVNFTVSFKSGNGEVFGIFHFSVRDWVWDVHRNWEKLIAKDRLMPIAHCTPILRVHRKHAGVGLRWPSVRLHPYRVWPCREQCSSSVFVEKWILLSVLRHV